MATSCYNQAPLSYSCESCEPIYKGRVISMAIVQLGSPLPIPTDEAGWAGLICNNLAVIIPQIRAEITSTINYGDGYGGVPQIAISTDHKLNAMQRFSVGNVDFYNDLMRYPGEYNLFYLSDKLLWQAGDPTSPAGVNWGVTVPITQELTSIVEFNIEASWNTVVGINKVTKWDPLPAWWSSCKALAAMLACYPDCPNIVPYPCP